MERLKEILWGEGLGLLSSLLDKFGGGEQRATRRQLLAGQSFFKQAVDPLLREMLKLCDSLHSRMSMVPGKEQSFALLQSLVAEGEEEIDDGGRDAGNGAYSRRESVGEGGGARRRNGGRKEGRMLSASEGEEEEDDDEEDEEEGEFGLTGFDRLFDSGIQGGTEAFADALGYDLDDDRRTDPFGF